MLQEKAIRKSSCKQKSNYYYKLFNSCNVLKLSIVLCYNNFKQELQGSVFKRNLNRARTGSLLKTFESSLFSVNKTWIRSNRVTLTLSFGHLQGNDLMQVSQFIKPWLTDWNGYETCQTPLLYVFVNLMVHNVQEHSQHFILLTNRNVALIYSVSICQTEHKELCTFIPT